MIPFGLLYQLLFLAASRPLPITYLIAQRTPAAIAASDTHKTIPDAVIQSVACNDDGEQLAFWCESLHGPIASCFAQTFARGGDPESPVVPVFDLPPTAAAVAAQGDGRFVSQWGSALWTSQHEAVLMLAYLRPNQGNRLLVQHWRAGKVDPPITITTEFDLDSWATLVQVPTGKLFALWLERDRSGFTVCAKRLSSAGTPIGETLRLQTVQQPARPGAVTVSAGNALTIAWADSHKYQPVVYARQFDDSGKPLGEPQALFDGRPATQPVITADREGRVAIAAAAPGGHVLVQAVGHGPLVVADNAEPGSVRIAMARGGEIALVWRDAKRAVWFGVLSSSLDSLTPPRAVATGVAPSFLNLAADGASWRLHFRKRPDNTAAAYLWLASASVVSAARLDDTAARAAN